MAKLRVEDGQQLTAEQRLDAEWTEAQFQSKVEKFIEALGGYHWHPRLPMYALAGHPDLEIWFPARGNGHQGWFGWAELKDYSGKLSAVQIKFIDSLRASGQTVYVWHPRDFYDAQDILQAHAGLPVLNGRATGNG